MPRFTAIIGDAGSGKTTLMTALLLAAHQSKRPVIANYTLRFPFRLMPFSSDDSKVLSLATSTDKVHIGEQSFFRNARVGMDELGKGADSYDFFLDKNRGLTGLAGQSRKLGCEIIYTVQRERMIAKRLRDLTDAFLFMTDMDASIPHCRCLKTEGYVCTCGTPYVCKGVSRIIVCDEFLTPVTRKRFSGSAYRPYFDTDEFVW